MAQAREQIVAGTAKEIAEYLQSADLGDKQLKLLVPTDDDISLAPRRIIRDQAHLEELLLEGLHSGPALAATREYWQQKRSKLEERSQETSEP